MHEEPPLPLPRDHERRPARSSEAQERSASGDGERQTDLDASVRRTDPGLDPPPLGRVGKAARVVVTMVCGALLVVGAVVGDDDDFPFGPFRMYATAAGTDAPVRSTRMEAVDAGGRRFVLTGGAVGLRRAEIEGQLGRFRREPALLGAVAAAYRNRHPAAPRLVRVEIVVRRFVLADARPTGEYTDTVEVGWSAGEPPR